MNTSLRISFLFLLLIIPQHGNSPLPVMESWLKKDQDDGFVQRDMTSSLTGGDESFGSAHQTYQNSLIRKRKSENSGNSLPSSNYRKFIGKVDLSQRYEHPEMIYDRRNYIPNNYNARAENSEQDDSALEEKANEMWLPADVYRSRMAKVKDQKMENIDPRLYNKYNSDKFEDLTSSNDMIQYNQMGNIPIGGRSNLNPFSEDMRRSNKWSLCKRMKERYSPNQQFGMESMPGENQENYVGVPYQDKYSGMDGVRDLDNPFKENQMGNRQEGKGPQIYNENDYYNLEPNPMGGENGEEEDYSQIISDHSQMNKRDGLKQQQRIPVAQNNMETSENNLNAGMTNLEGKAGSVSGDEIKSVKDDMVAEMRKPFQSNVANLKGSPDSDMMWKMNSNLQSKALQDVMKNSQRALQEVQMYQQKLALKSPDIGEGGGNSRVSRHQPSVSWESKKAKFDEKRLKREDEDEQKNMKTGTDEGGGGEYEDEEGKGHKDEEEYYEDADLSEGESENESPTYNSLNQKYVKREADKASKKSEKSISSKDYELSLENAPVENSEKSKSPLHGEGENTKKNSARKGVKIWDQWGKWSACSVTCGVGRSTRWRHCIGGGCAQGEKEAQIKRCTNPAC